VDVDVVGDGDGDDLLRPRVESHRTFGTDAPMKLVETRTSRGCTGLEVHRARDRARA
jgi:hypothetical protein